jgi:UDP-glucose 4-epimerase
MNQFSGVETQRVLVTGGAGAIGSALVKELLEDGFHVTVLDNLRTGSLENLPKPDSVTGLKFIHADLCDPTSYFRQISDCDAIFHLATLRKWPERDDYVASLGLIRALRNIKIKLLVLHSTAMVYGNAKVVPTPENYVPLDPIMSYEASKYKCEQLMTTFAVRRRMPMVTLRFANVVGGTSYHGVSRDYFERLLVDPTNLRVLGDGFQRRSYVHLDDCVSAIMSTARIAREGQEVYNVASEDAIDLHEVIEAVTKEMGIEPPHIDYTGAVSEGGGWPGDPRTVHLDTTKLQAVGWKANYDSKGAIRKAVSEMSGKKDVTVSIRTSTNFKQSTIELRILEKSHWDRAFARLGRNRIASGRYR